jgi:phenylpropionate dioxygenase-like ring-hydroxylating dioxygenase large terminal subunit
VADGLLECGYHGWRFDQEGTCKKVPSLCGAQESAGRNAPRLACRAQDRFIWVWGELAGEPEGDPFRFELDGAPGYTTVREHVVANGTMHATIENALDVPHTAFAHAGLFRSDDRVRNRIEVVVRRSHDRVEAEYIGEPRPEGVVGRILSPGGGVVQHWDRFILPSVLQVEYRLGDTHLLVSAVATPESDYVTHLWPVISFKMPIPGWTIVPVLKPLAMRIFKQDADILELQTETIHRFGGEQFVSTEVDVLGPHILRLLRAAERGKIEPGGEPTEKRFEMEV